MATKKKAAKRKKARKSSSSSSSSTSRRSRRGTAVKVEASDPTADGQPLWCGRIELGGKSLDLGCVVAKTERQAVQKFRRVARQLV